jgi:hypothetical protein
MRKVDIVGAPPQDWIDEANVLTAKLYKITEVFDAGKYALAAGLTALSNMPTPVANGAVLGEVNGRLHLQVANDASELIFNEGEVFLAKNWKTRIDTIRSLLPADWKTGLTPAQHTSLAKELKELARLAFTLRNETHWRDDRIRDWLLDQFGNKCWYSEASESVSPIHIEHFRPKSSAVDDRTKMESEGYWWLAFDWKNYRICGHYLNSKKGDFFPLHNIVRATACGGVPIALESPIVIDPTSDAATQISFDKDEDDCIAVCSDPDLDINHEDRIEVERTFSVLGLNEYDRLKQKRATIWNECLEHIDRYKAPASVPNFKAVIRAGITDQLKKKVSYRAEFSSVAIACLQKKAPLSLQNAVFKPQA